MHPQTSKTETGQSIMWAAVQRIATEDLMLRLDAGAYCNQSRKWDSTIAKQAVLRRLDSLGEVYQPIVFGKRDMSGTSEKGISVFSSSEMLMYNPAPSFFLSRRFEDKVVKSLGIKSGWVLVSRTGSIGYTLYVSEDRHGWVVDDHMIRIIPHNSENGAFLYTYLSSPIGQSALNSLAYGAVQSVIKGHQVAEMNIPIPNRTVLTGIAEKVRKASEKRVLAQKLLGETDLLIEKVTGLPPLKGAYPDITKSERKVVSFAVPSVNVNDRGVGSEYRLDAHFYNPTAQLAVENIKRCRGEVKTVGKVTNRVFFCNRFTRTYVEIGHGIPYLAGKNIVQIRPTDVAYLSRSQTRDLDQYRLERGWILITCSGTIGRTCLVWKNFEEHVATHDLIRVIPLSTEVDGGYLYAFLSSQYGRIQVLRYRHGSVIDHVTPEQIQRVLVPCPPRKDQEKIGDMVREAYDKRAEAIRLEDEAQAILMDELTKAQGAKEV